MNTVAPCEQTEVSASCPRMTTGGIADIGDLIPEPFGWAWIGNYEL